MSAVESTACGEGDDDEKEQLQTCSFIVVKFVTFIYIQYRPAVNLCFGWKKPSGK